MTLNERLADLFRTRQLSILRYDVSVRNALIGYLAQLDTAIAAAIIKVSPSEPARERYRQQRVEQLIEAVDQQISAAYRNIVGHHREELSGMAQAEALFLIQQVNRLLERDLVKVDLPAREAAALVRSSLISGAPMASWWQQQSTATRDRFAREMRIGMIAGETDADLIRRIRGTAALGYKDGMMEVSRRAAKIIVRGASSAVSSAVRKMAVEDNPRAFRGIQQISVLDGRTSDTCMAYAGRAWKVPGYEPIGHSLPYNGGVPRHPNCRSTEIAVLTEEFGGAPAPDMGFDEFLASKSPDEQDRLLGKGRAQLYRDRKITLADLVDQNGRPLTLEQLKAIH